VVFHTACLGLPLSQEIVILNSGEVIGCGSTPAEILTVTDFLDVAKTTGNATIAVTVKCVKVQRHSRITAGVDLVTVKDRLHSLVHNLRGSGAVGVHEVMTLIGVIVTLNIAVTKRQLDSALVRFLAAELGDTFLNRSTTAALIALMVSVSSFGISTDTEYFSAPPLMLTGSQPWK